LDVRQHAVQKSIEREKSKECWSETIERLLKMAIYLINTLLKAAYRSKILNAASFVVKQPKYAGINYNGLPNEVRN